MKSVITTEKIIIAYMNFTKQSYMPMKTVIKIEKYIQELLTLLNERDNYILSFAGHIEHIFCMVEVNNEIFEIIDKHKLIFLKDKSALTSSTYKTDNTIMNIIENYGMNYSSKDKRE